MQGIGFVSTQIVSGGSKWLDFANNITNAALTAYVVNQQASTGNPVYNPSPYGIPGSGYNPISTAQNQAAAQQQLAAQQAALQAAQRAAAGTTADPASDDANQKKVLQYALIGGGLLVGVLVLTSITKGGR